MSHTPVTSAMLPVCRLEIVHLGARADLVDVVQEHFNVALTGLEQYR
jgi:hypothetical protein